MDYDTHEKDHLADMLNVVNLNNNLIVKLPTTFGAAGRNIKILKLWTSLQWAAISKLNLTEMTQLRRLNVRCNEYNGALNSALFQDSLKRISSTGILNLLNFATRTPFMKLITANKNTISKIPEDLATIATLQILGIHTNKLSTLPDLYHLPLENCMLLTIHWSVTNPCAG